MIGFVLLIVGMIIGLFLYSIVIGGINGELKNALEEKAKMVNKLMLQINSYIVEKNDLFEAVKMARQTIYDMRNGDPEFIPNQDVEVILLKIIKKVEKE